MRIIRKFTVLTTLACLIFATTGFYACGPGDKQRNIAFARDISSSLRVTATVIEPRNPQLAARVRRAADSADKIVTAIEASNSVEIAALVRDILPVFTEVAREFSNNQNVLLALALGQIALNFFVNHYIKAGSQESAEVSVVEFKSLPQFGCQLRPEKCK